MPKRRKPQFLDPWTLAKIVRGGNGLFWAAGLERHLEQEQLAREGPWPVWNDVDPHLERFEPLLGHLIDWGNPKWEQIECLSRWSIQMEHMELLDRLSEVENTYQVVDRVLDFSIELAERFEQLERRHTKRMPQTPILSDDEYDEIRSINFDIEEFRYEETPREDLFYCLGQIERSIRDGERPDDSDIVTLRQICRLRPRGTPRVYAFRYLIIALAELYCDENEFGERARVTPVTIPEEEYDWSVDYDAMSEEEVAAVRPINDVEYFSSPFKDFVTDFAETCNIVLPDDPEKPYAVWSHARQILRDWNKVRSKKLLRGLERQASLEAVVRLITHVIK